MKRQFKEITEEFTEEFIDSLARKPYCADESKYVCIRSRKIATKKEYIQVNHPESVQYLVFDIDREGGVLAWYDNGLPPPAWTTKNPKNAHAHIAYRLRVPVFTCELAGKKAIKYMNAIKSAMTEKLQADRGYVGLITKNPLHPQWDTYLWTEHTYSLDELADYLDLRGHPRKRGVESIGEGRNCELLETGAKWAYKAIRDYWKPNYRDEWEEAVYRHVENLNWQFSEPLPYSEVRSIAKSIAKWTYKHFSPQELREWHSKKGREGGKKGGKKGSKEAKARAGAIGGKKSKGGGRPDKKALLPRVLEMREQGYNYRGIAEDLDISVGTITNWLKNL